MEFEVLGLEVVEQNQRPQDVEHRLGSEKAEVNKLDVVFSTYSTPQTKREWSPEPSS